MTGYTTREVQLLGKKRILQALTGVVLGANQRSDTYVRGSGGTGGGSVRVSSQVVVRSDIWIRDAAGEEHRLRFNNDIPVREGNIVHQIDILDETGEPLSKGNYFAFYNSSTHEPFYINKYATYKPWSIYLRHMMIILGILLGILGLFFKRSMGISFSAVLFALPSTIVHVLILARKSDREVDAVMPGFLHELDEVANRFANPGQAAPATIAVVEPQAVPALGSKAAFCAECGAAIAANTAFCSGCGNKLANQVSA